LEPSELRVGIIGAGLQGRRRAPTIHASGAKLVTISADSKDFAQADVLAKTYGCEATIGWENVIKRDDINVVVICTPPHLHAEISVAALENRKHVLCEKPLSRTLQEAKDMVATAERNHVKLKCGFNHRFHPALFEAKKIVESGECGQPSFVRCRYGIGGRPGFENEWRANPKLAGGGELMDQGTHAIDLSRWFLGEIAEVFAFTANYLPNVTSVEDNCFLLLRTKRGNVASIHVSLTQWKNLFSFEVFCSDGYLIAEGLGGSYGNERLIVGKRDYTKPFKEEIIEFRGEDLSWLNEWKDFVAAIIQDREPMGNGYDGIAAMQLVEAAYHSGQTKSSVTL
jgi:predicted dehydrogenase